MQRGFRIVVADLNPIPSGSTSKESWTQEVLTAGVLNGKEGEGGGGGAFNPFDDSNSPEEVCVRERGGGGREVVD